MNIRHLRTLVTIADHDTFAEAADVIGLTQSAISQQVKSLETTLGVELFDRGSRPPTLSLHGQSLVERGRDILALWDETITTYSSDVLSGALHLGAIRSSMTGALPEALSNLRRSYPKIHIRLYSGNSDDLIGRVSGGHLDTALVCGFSEIGTGLSWAPFANEPLVVIAPKSIAARSAREMLETQPYIRFENGSAVTRLIHTEIERRGINIRQEMEVNASLSAALMVANGLGVSVMPRQYVSGPFPKNVRAVPFGDPQIIRQIGLVERKTSTKDSLTRTLWRELWRLSGRAEF